MLTAQIGTTNVIIWRLVYTCININQLDATSPWSAAVTASLESAEKQVNFMMAQHARSTSASKLCM